MATKRLEGVKEADFVEVDGAAEDITALDESQEAELRGVLSDLNDDPNAQTVYLKVFKFLDGQDKPWECFKANPTEMDDLTDRIRREFGGGKYRIHIIRNKKLFRQVDLPILAPLTQAAPANSQSGDLAAIFRQMADNQQRQFEQMKELFLQKTGTPAAPTNPVEMMTAMMGAMVQMKDFITPPAQNNSFDNFLQLLTVAQDFNQNKGDSNFIDVIRDGMKTLAPVIGESMKNAPARVSQTQTGQSAQTAETQNDETVQMEKPQMGMQEMMIKMYVGNLVTGAKKGDDPSLYAEMIFAQVPQEIIKDRLLLPNAIDQLSQINPEVRTYTNWFQQVQQILIDMAIENGLISDPNQEPPPA